MLFCLRLSWDALPSLFCYVIRSTHPVLISFLWNSSCWQHTNVYRLLVLLPELFSKKKWWNIVLLLVQYTKKEVLWHDNVFLLETRSRKEEDIKKCCHENIFCAFLWIIWVLLKWEMVSSSKLENYNECDVKNTNLQNVACFF